MWRGLSWIGFIFLLCAALIIAARQIGSMGTSRADYLEPICDLPCWQGVKPGETAYNQFQKILESVRSENTIRTSAIIEEQGTVTALVLGVRGKMRLGDVIQVYGAPQYIQVRRSAVLISTGGSREVYTDFYLYWADGYVEVRVSYPGLTLRLSPLMEVVQIFMREPVGDSIVPLGSLPWQGFVHMPLTD